MRIRMEILNAFYGGVRVGTFFRRAGEDVVEFEYEESCREPISLSLPLSGEWAPSAPGAFLDGLLPDGGNDRLKMRIAIGAESEDPFELLSNVDASGGLVFSRNPEVDASTGLLEPVTRDDFMARAADSLRPSNIWWEPGRRARFSLAGTQAKFSIAKRGGRWFWPNAEVPSTHIVKPSRRSSLSVSEVENATLKLAGLCGLKTEGHAFIEADDFDAVVLERFDRELLPAGGARRLRAEDLCQALGRGSKAKYDVEIAELVSLLRKAGARDETLYGLIEQIAFNTYSGNADGHAKNYTVLLDDGISLAPLYDAVVTWVWPGFDNSLAMGVNDVWFPWELDGDDWAREAEKCGLDDGKVREIAERMETGVLENAPKAAGAISEEAARRAFVSAIEQANGIQSWKAGGGAGDGRANEEKQAIRGGWDDVPRGTEAQAASPSSDKKIRISSRAVEWGGSRRPSR